MRTITKLLLILIFSLNFNSYGQINVNDSLALVDIYNSTNGNMWTYNDNWLTGTVDTWQGITVENNRVTEIEMTGNVTGTLPSTIGNLTALTSINIVNTGLLTGQIPAEIGNLIELRYLNLSGNNLTGTIPDEIGNLVSLQQLLLSSNQLINSIPESIGNLTQLFDLRLENNQLTKPIPESICNLNLSYLYLNNNELTGELPQNIGNMTNMFDLKLYNNQLEGAVPASIGNFLVADIDIRNNYLTDLPDCSGFPVAIIDCENNRFTFEDLEPNINIGYISYIPQDSVCSEIDTTAGLGNDFELTCYVGGSANVYQWYKDSVLISGAINETYTIFDAAYADSGVYTCEITNTIVTDLTLYRKPITLHVDTLTVTTHAPDITQEIKIFPNPASDIVYIESFAKGIVALYDLTGRKVAETETNKFSQETKLELSTLPKGMYIINITTEAGNYSEKIIVK